jgi:hypothetical protein
MVALLPEQGKTSQARPSDGLGTNRPPTDKNVSAHRAPAARGWAPSLSPGLSREPSLGLCLR